MTYKNIIPEIFASIIATIAGLIIFISNLGFENYGLVILQAVFLSYFLIYAPNMVAIMISKQSYTEWYTSKSFILLICIFILVFAGEINIIWDTMMFPFFALLGGCSIVVSLVKLKKFHSLKNTLLLCLFFCFLGICFTTVPYIEFFSHPLIKEKIVTGAWAHRDAVWFPAIAGMFKSYGVSSSGIDGLVPLNYHTFSHFVYGSLSGLLGINTITFFYICAPILIAPLFFLSFIFCVKEVGDYFANELNFTRIDEKTFKYWVPFSVLFLLPLPYQLIGYLNGERYQYLGSSSYNFALILTFIFISIIFTFINTFNYKDFVTPSNKLIISLISIVLLLVISFSKVSFLLILGFIYSYIFLRFKYYKNFFHVFTMIGFVFVFVLVFYSIIYTETFLMNEAQTNSADTSLGDNLIYLFPSLFFIVFKFLSQKDLSLNRLYNKFKLGSLIEVEILLALAIVLYFVPFQYFKGFQLYIAYIMIMSQLHIFRFKTFEND